MSKTLPFPLHVQILYSYVIVDLHYLNADLHLKVSARETCTDPNSNPAYFPLQGDKQVQDVKPSAGDISVPLK